MFSFSRSVQNIPQELLSTLRFRMYVKRPHRSGTPAERWFSFLFRSLSVASAGLLLVVLLLTCRPAWALSPPPPVLPPPHAGEPALHVAVAISDIALVRELVARGAASREQSAKGRLPIHWLRPDDPATIDILRLLIRNGARINDRDTLGNTALHYASRAWDSSLASGLLALGSDINARNQAGITPLVATLETYPRKPKGELHGILNQLLDAGGDRTDPRLLQKAVSRNDPILLDLFLKLGADTNLGSFVDRHSLLPQAARGNPEIVALLLKAGLDPNHGSTGFTAISYVLTTSPTPDSIETTRLLFQYGARPNERVYYGSTPLMIAAQTSTALVALLIDHGADLEIRSPSGMRAFEEAIKYAQHDSIALMIAKGIKINSSDSKGDTSLHYATKALAESKAWPSAFERRRVVDALLNAGADPDARNADNKTPFDYIPTLSKASAVLE